MKKILFIEDEPALQKTLAGTLGREGYEVFSALDGDAGTALAVREHPDLILLDLVLPKKDGFAVLEELKKNQETKNIPVIIMSNLESTGDVERALELGATTYLVKTSYSLEEIAEKIRGLLQQSEKE